MKKVLTIFIAVGMVMALFAGVFTPVPSARAANITKGDYTLILNGTGPETATIVGYTGAGGIVGLASTLGGYPVTSIGGSAADITIYAQGTAIYIPTPTPVIPTPVPVKKPLVLILQIGKLMFWNNSVPTKLDSAPVIKNSRTLLPIRAIIEALGGTIAWDPINHKVTGGTITWDPIDHKVTVALGNKTLVLWIGKDIATVNGVSIPIDSTDIGVVPEIINGRTMLPLRFVAENLDAIVGWEQNMQTITITYTP
jgi:hypothetical protein